jgi:hypothetical protein
MAMETAGSKAMRHSILALVTVLSMPVSASTDVMYDTVFPGHRHAQSDSDSDGFSGDSPVMKSAVLPALALGGEYSRSRLQRDRDLQTAILQGFVYIPDATLMLVVGAGWPTARIDPENRHADQSGPIYSLQGRVRFSEQLGLLLGVDHIALHADGETNVYRANLMMSDADSPVGIVFTYELSDTSGPAGDADTYGLGLRCNF